MIRELFVSFKSIHELLTFLMQRIPGLKGRIEIIIDEDFNGVDVDKTLILRHGGFNERTGSDRFKGA